MARRLILRPGSRQEATPAGRSGRSRPCGDGDLRTHPRRSLVGAARVLSPAARARGRQRPANRRGPGGSHGAAAGARPLAGQEPVGNRGARARPGTCAPGQRRRPGRGGHPVPPGSLGLRWQHAHREPAALPGRPGRAGSPGAHHPGAARHRAARRLGDAHAARRRAHGGGRQGGRDRARQAARRLQPAGVPSGHLRARGGQPRGVPAGARARLGRGVRARPCAASARGAGRGHPARAGRRRRRQRRRARGGGARGHGTGAPARARALAP